MIKAFFTVGKRQILILLYKIQGVIIADLNKITKNKATVIKTDTTKTVC